MRLLQRKGHGFTLVELLVVITVLTALVLLLTQLINQIALITTLAHKRMDADSQARPLFDRMAVDFSQMIKRSDVAYYLKTADTPMPGNDLLGFYSAVQGFYSTTPSPISVVAYRVNSDSSNALAHNCLERMGKGLDWNGASSVNTPIVFLPLTLHGTWPSVASSSAYDDADPAKRAYEIIGPQVFRFEYYYVERATGKLVVYPATWTSLSSVAIKDAAAVVAGIAVIDSRSKALLTNSQVEALIDSLPDYSTGWGLGELRTRWQSALESVADLPRAATAGVRVYERCFYISDL